MEHSWGWEQISKWTPVSSRNSPSLHHQQSLSHGPGKIWLILYWIIFLHSFISTGRTDKLFDHKALLSAKSHFRVVMANDLASWLRESQVVSMCLKLATPRTSGGLNKTLCIKVRKMKRRSLHRTYPTFNDTVRRYHQCQWNIYAAESARGNWCPNFCLTPSPQTSFLSLQMLMQRRSSTETTKAQNHFFVFFIFSSFFFFFQTISSSLHESISVHRSLPKAAVRNRLWHWYLLHFIIQTVNWDCRQCSSPEHINWTSRPHPDKEKGVANRLRPLWSHGVLDASTICPVDSR